jgi:thymidine kinase
MAELLYYCGTMDSGKSTLALQTAHNHKSRGRKGLLFTNKDRAGYGQISSRLGLQSNALEVEEEFDIHRFVVQKLSIGERVDFIICDEAQFYTPEHIEQLARIVDGLSIDVFCFGILADFRTRLFPGSARLVELADRVLPLQVEALCWCGERATQNARSVNGVMVTEGEQVVVGDIIKDSVISYEVLCRRHHMRKVTSRSSSSAQYEPLPFKSDVESDLESEHGTYEDSSHGTSQQSTLSE